MLCHAERCVVVDLLLKCDGHPVLVCVLRACHHTCVGVGHGSGVVRGWLLLLHCHCGCDETFYLSIQRKVRALLIS